MKEIAFVSGKGGTGKTTISASIGYLANAIIADCDVDAANIHIIYRPKIKKSYEYVGGSKAIIDEDKCIGCGICKEVCRFDAVFKLDNGKYRVDEYACEGCKACVIKCPVQAIELKSGVSGHYYMAEGKGLPIIFANLKPGEENSGKLVAEVRKLAKTIQGYNLIVVDGAPGIGCSAVSSVSGVDYAVVVSEPTNSAVHDLKRIVKTLNMFDIPFGVVINKSTINKDIVLSIHKYCKENNIDVIGEVPFDNSALTLLIEGRLIVEQQDNEASISIKQIWEKLKVKLNIN